MKENQPLSCDAIQRAAIFEKNIVHFVKRAEVVEALVHKIMLISIFKSST